MGKAVNLNRANKKKPKKRYFLVPLSVLLVILLIFKMNFDSILFDIGKSAYDGKDYQKAYSIFELLEKKDSENQNYTYYKVLSLSKMPLTYSNQTKLIGIASANRPIRGKSIAVHTINAFKSNIIRVFGRNYIEDAIPGGDVVRWNLSASPITYYIEATSDVPSNYIDIVEKSFQKWQRASNSLVTFNKTEEKDKANITVFFVDRPQSNYSMNSNEEYNVGLATPIIKDEKLQQIKIELLKKNNLGSYFTPRAFSTVTTHEIGHALGIWGHSINRNNIMFYSADRDMGTYEVFISQEDVNTLKLLYSLKPDITNVKISPEDEKNLINTKIVLGNIENSSEKIYSCINFLNKRPDDINRWLNLSEAYNEDQQFDMAIRTLLEALGKSPNSEIKYIVYYDLAINYIALEQYDKALYAAINAKSISDDLDIKLLMSDIYAKQKKYKYAEGILVGVIKDYPNNLDAAMMLADIYIKQGKHWQARSILKKFIKKNPQAKDNEFIKRYAFYTIF